MNKSMRPIVWLAIIFVGLAALAAVYAIFNKKPAETVIDKVAELNRSIGTERNRGNYEVAVSRTKRVLEDPSTTNEQKAIATYLSAGALYHITGNIDDRITEIEALKKIVADEGLSLETRTAALNTVASAYTDSGRDPKIFATLYKGQPWESSMVVDDPEQSALNLYQWSFSLKPTAVAAVHIADWYALLGIYRGKEVQATTTDTVAKADQFLKIADSLAAQEAANEPMYQDGNRNEVYRTWKVDTLAALTTQKGGEAYKDLYKSEVESYIDYALATTNILAKDDIYFARFNYASVLNKQNDTIGAKAQLDAIAQGLSELSNPYTYAYVNYVRNMLTFQSSGPTANRIKVFSQISPNFDAAIKKLIAGAPPASVSSATIKDGR